MHQVEVSQMPLTVLMFISAESAPSHLQCTSIERNIDGYTTTTANENRDTHNTEHRIYNMSSEQRAMSIFNMQMNNI